MPGFVELEVPNIGRLKMNVHADGDPYISGVLLAGHVFEPHILNVLRAFLKPGDRFLDVGANIGWFALIGSRLVGIAGRVYAIEPDPDNYRLLHQNLAANQCRNVRHWLAAAGQRSRKALLSRSLTNRGDHRLAVRSVSEETVRVKVRPVDRLLWPTRRIDTMLVDTQGSEVNVFQGMQSTLRRNPKLRIVFEYWPHGLETCGSTTEDLADIARRFGWVMWLLENATSVRQIRADDLVLLARDQFNPASQRHADVVALSAQDHEAIAFMQSLSEAAAIG